MKKLFTVLTVVAITALGANEAKDVKIVVDPPMTKEAPSKTAVVNGKLHHLGEPVKMGGIDGMYYQEVLKEVKDK